ncbi:glycoside hydrolase family 3 N-terminal domain-containing protein [Planosporangium sp. 12N6]|uniref:glycoside hydrolase family 3 N-terminal domain-containing protein n=1 Tax=Planosporangium spinosum TaxID=3402278 RepID=UPI003CEE8292
MYLRPGRFDPSPRQPPPRLRSRLRLRPPLRFRPRLRRAAPLALAAVALAVATTASAPSTSAATASAPSTSAATASSTTRTAAGSARVHRAAAYAYPYQDPSRGVPERVADLLARMSLDEKVGQMTQAERAAVTTADVTGYRVGSILSGGGSAPTPNTPAGWADMYDAFQRAALATPLGIPMIYGLDAVHGNNNVYGSTIFPHNIGLGATRDPALVQQIGRATAEEVTGAGLDWTFAPCLCVARNDRWGRTYESFGENPDLVSSMTTVVTGLQGPSLSAPAVVLATAKHYLGDGGTTGGRDQGDTQLSEQDLRAIHLPPFKAAVDRGVGAVMVSYSSWNGVKMHGNRYLITDVLKGELGFTGFVVSDWAAIDQLDGATGFTQQEVTTAINAGLDMIMVPNDYKTFIGYLKSAAQSGAVPMSRIDDAVRRILTKKFELGLFEHPYADRSYAQTVGSQAHRDLARQAVRESQVLLKNAGGILPLAKTGGKLFVAGKNADDLGNSSGGWTISWQGRSGAIVPGTTILQGIRSAVGAGTTVTYNRDGSGIDSSYRAAIAVVGETPYAEGQGDRTGSLGLDATDLSTLQRLRASGVPVVTVLVSGRPLDIAAQLPDWSALLAAWLPGSEGAGVADVLFGDYNPTGKLPVTWPASADQEPINDGDGKTGLFGYGYGLSYPTGGPTPTPAPTPTPTPTSTPTPTPTRTPTPTAPPTPPAGVRCTVTYRVTSQWSGGFVGDVAVSVTGGTVDGWTLAFAFPDGQRITSAWNATVTQNGSQVSARDIGWNGHLGSATWGFQATTTGANAPPTGFTLNGAPCATG